MIHDKSQLSTVIYGEGESSFIDSVNNKRQL